jgi:hypothetical protein
MEESNTKKSESRWIRKDHKLCKIKLLRKGGGDEYTKLRKINAQSATKE